MPPSPASWQYFRVYSPGGTYSGCWLFETSATSCPLTFWPLTGVRVTCDVGYLSANFSLPRLLCSRVSPDVRDRQIDCQTKASLNASALWGRRHNNASPIRKFSGRVWLWPVTFLFENGMGCVFYKREENILTKSEVSMSFDSGLMSLNGTDRWTRRMSGILRNTSPSYIEGSVCRIWLINRTYCEQQHVLRTSITPRSLYTTGLWTQHEHQAFLVAAALPTYRPMKSLCHMCVCSVYCFSSRLRS